MGFPYTLTSVKHMRSKIIKHMRISTPFEILEASFEVQTEGQGSPEHIKCNYVDDSGEEWAAKKVTIFNSIFV